MYECGVNGRFQKGRIWKGLIPDGWISAFWKDTERIDVWIRDGWIVGSYD